MPTPTAIVVPSAGIDFSSLSISISGALLPIMVAVLAIGGMLLVFKLTRSWFMSSGGGYEDIEFDERESAPSRALDMDFWREYAAKRREEDGEDWHD